MRLINGIFAALSSSIAIADLHLMILTILTTPRGLGFTRARLFTAGDRPALFTGALALGCESAHGLQDLELEIRNVSIGEGFFVAEWQATGTNAGDFPGIPASGARFRMRGASVIELRDGRIHRYASYWDTNSMKKLFSG
ncbi:MAG: ester cyclase [Candidatus Sumerlaeia bacterium]|nr:ester cyclase [Candidatus Sumerlaeia bacterium]